MTRLGDVSLEETLLERFQTKDQLLIPDEADVQTLQGVIPTYSAVLALDDQVGGLQLTKTWRDDVSAFVCTSASWERLDKQHTASKLLDVALVDPQDSSAWTFEMVGTTAIIEDHQIPSSLRELSGCHCDIDDTARDLNTTQLWIKLNNPRLIDKRQIQQQIKWRYNMKTTDYILEIAKTQNFQYLPAKVGEFGDQQCIVSEPRWQLSVLHRRWEDRFAENARLEIGMGATWAANVNEWFPPDDGTTAAANKGSETGVEALLKKLMQLQMIARGRRI